MEYYQIDGVSKPISRIVFGSAMPKMFAAFRSVYGNEPDFENRLQTAFEILDDAYSEGINCIDCADHYGEEPVGEWLESRGLHDKVVILTKGAHHNAWRKRVTPYDILHDCHNSLAKLKTNQIDIYLLHRDDPSVPVGPIMDTLNRLYEEGKIRVFGTSNWSVERFTEANEYALKNGLRPFIVVSPNFGLANQVADPWGGGCYTISGASDNADRKFYAENDIPVFAYSALGRGFFSGRFHSDEYEKAKQILEPAAVNGYLCPENMERLRRCELLAKEKQVTVAQIAMAYIFNQHDLRVFALTSPGSKERVKESTAALELQLTDEECSWLNLEKG